MDVLLGEKAGHGKRERRESKWISLHEAMISSVRVSGAQAEHVHTQQRHHVQQQSHCQSKARSVFESNRSPDTREERQGQQGTVSSQHPPHTTALSATIDRIFPALARQLSGRGREWQWQSGQAVQHEEESREATRFIYGPRQRKKKQRRHHFHCRCLRCCAVAS